MTSEQLARIAQDQRALTDIAFEGLIADNHKALQATDITPDEAYRIAIELGAITKLRKKLQSHIDTQTIQSKQL